jgi:uncharacterized coiled-coil protein SlyX
VKLHTKELDNDLQVMNYKIGQLEATQIATNAKLTGLEMLVDRIDKSLAALLKHFHKFHTKTNDQHKEDSKRSERVEDNWDDYVADTEQDDEEGLDCR